MTIPSTPRKAGPYAGTSAQTAFPFTFKVFSASDVEVRVTLPGVGEQVVDAGDYSVALNVNQDTSPGGVVTYPLTGSPMGSDARLTVLGALEYDQPLDLPSGGRFSDVALENELDRIVMQIQQVAEVADRAIKSPATAGTAALDLPAPEANKSIGWDSTGTTLVNLDPADLAGDQLLADWHTDRFTGSGFDTYNLTYPPSTLDSTWVYIDGVAMTPLVDFDLSASSLIFTVAPAIGAEIVARYGRIVRGEPVSREVYRVVATEGQTVFTLTGGYLAGQNAIAAYVNGLRMESGGVDYVETSDTTVTFVAGLQAGDSVVFVVGTETLGGSTVAWGSVTGKPPTYAPSAHVHAVSDVTGLTAALTAKQDALTSGENIKTVNGVSLLGSGNIVISGGGGSPAASGVLFTPAGSISSANVQAAIQELDTEKQAALVSGTNIKTINGTSLLGGGDITISGGGTLTADAIITALETGANAGTLSFDSTAPNAASHTLLLNRTADKTGGTRGHVYSALFIDTTVAAGVTNFEWGLTSRVNNSATGGENVGVYGQGNKLATGPTWGGCFEVCDAVTWGGTNSTSGGTVGCEVDVWCNGSDNFEQRIGLDVVVGNAQLMRTDPPVAGPKGYAYDGIRIGAQGNNNALGAFLYGIKIMSADQAGIVNTASGLRGIHHTGSYTVGIDLSQSTNSDSAIRIKANEYIALDAFSAVKFRYNSSNGYLEFFNGTTRRGYINMTSGADGDLAAGGGSAPANMVTTDTTQTITGAKTFNGITASSVTVSGASRYIGQTIASYYNLSAFGGANAKAFTDSTALNIDTICTDGVIRTYMSSTPTNVQVESVMRPLYCIVSTLVKELQDKKVI